MTTIFLSTHSMAMGWSPDPYAHQRMNMYLSGNYQPMYIPSNNVPNNVLGHPGQMGQINRPYNPYNMYGNYQIYNSQRRAYMPFMNNMNYTMPGFRGCVGGI